MALPTAYEGSEGKVVLPKIKRPDEVRQIENKKKNAFISRHIIASSAIRLKIAGLSKIGC